MHTLRSLEIRRAFRPKHSEQLLHQCSISRASCSGQANTKFRGRFSRGRFSLEISPGNRRTDNSASFATAASTPSSISTTGMADPSLYKYPSPLEGYDKNREPLPMEKSEDGKSFKNPQHGVLSPAYERFTDGLSNGRRGGFDIHVYFLHTDARQLQFAKELWERVRREFPELRIYTVWDRPIGPHPVGMFEVNLFTPAQFGAFIPWLVINRGPLSVLIHPNHDDGDEERDHTQRATWMGDRYPLNLGIWRQ